MFPAPSQPIVNPETPFIHHIDGGLYPGVIILFDGVAPSYSVNFQLNLTTGVYIDGPNRSNTMLHFNPRFNERYVARNSFHNGQWDKEEGGGGFPFKKEIPFHLMILVEEHQFKVAVDGVHFIDFIHRHPYELVNTLQIFGEVVVHKVDIIRSGSASVPAGTNTSELGVSPPAPVCSLELYNPPVPFKQPIPRGLRSGTTILISGKPKLICNRFHINLEKDGGPEPDILLHFNPRYDPKVREVVRNSRVGGTWGQEEANAPSFPFVPGATFDLMILCDNNHYMLNVNGQHYVSFEHRQPFEQAKNLVIEGDLTITTVRISHAS